ncbi:MAG TPA: DUF481 domain-containing protein [Pirellulaceae bacterium]
MGKGFIVHFRNLIFRGGFRGGSFALALGSLLITHVSPHVLGQSSSPPRPSQILTPAIIADPLWDAAPQSDLQFDDQLMLAPPSEGFDTEPGATVDGIASQLAPGTELGDPPIEGFWYDPRTWFLPSLWDASVEVGLNGSDGNANAQALTTGLELSRKTPLNDWDIDLTYNRSESNDVLTQHNALLFSNWDWKLQNLPTDRWSVFTKTQLVYDEFKNFDLQFTLNSGLGYLVIDNDLTQFKGRFGSGVTRDFGGVMDDWTPEAAFGVDLNHQLTKRQKIAAVLDYFPAWSQFSDYRIVSNVSWEVVLDEVHNLSLKLNVIDRYDSTPDGLRPNDVNYSVLLIWAL